MRRSAAERGEGRERRVNNNNAVNNNAKEEVIARQSVLFCLLCLLACLLDFCLLVGWLVGWMVCFFVSLFLSFLAFSRLGVGRAYDVGFASLKQNQNVITQIPVLWDCPVQ